MLILALDTCLGACSVAVANAHGSLASTSEPMTRGHQERLAPMVREIVASSGARFRAIDRVAVTVGPGSFTGLRVGLAFAKGLALALERPCVGVGALEAIAFSSATDGWVVAAIDAGRGQLYFQVFQDGRPLTAPDVLPIEGAAARVFEIAGTERVTLAGPGAARFAETLPRARPVDMIAPSPVVIARLGAVADLAPARPFYLRAPDAKPKLS